MAIRNIDSATSITSTTSPAPEGDTLAQSQYKFNYLVFPSDIGMDYMGHYMVININAPTTIFGGYAGSYTGSEYITEINPAQKSKVDVLRYGSGVSGSLPVVVGGGTNRPAFSVPRSTRRIAESIALHMPTPLVFNHQNQYEEVGLTALAGKVGIAAGAGVLGGVATGILGSIGSGIAQNAAQVAQIAQSPINPAVEILFASTAQRQFTMEVLMAPKDETESKSMEAIIKTLRFHGVPELSVRSGGLLLIPPAEFDITFFNKGTENMHILRMNTCVLERCEVDYAPGGVYSTFRNGHPVAVRLSLGLRELEPLHKKRILQGF